MTRVRPSRSCSEHERSGCWRRRCPRRPCSAQRRGGRYPSAALGRPAAPARGLIPSTFPSAARSGPVHAAPPPPQRDGPARPDEQDERGRAVEQPRVASAAVTNGVRATRRRPVGAPRRWARNASQAPSLAVVSVRVRFSVRASMATRRAAGTRRRVIRRAVTNGAVASRREVLGRVHGRKTLSIACLRVFPGLLARDSWRVLTGLAGP